MQEMNFKVANVKCGGCATTIRDGLMSLPGVVEVAVEVSGGEVAVRGESLAHEVLVAKLIALGYPVQSG